MLCLLTPFSTNSSCSSRLRTMINKIMLVNVTETWSHYLIVGFICEVKIWIFYNWPHWIWKLTAIWFNWIVTTLKARLRLGGVLSTAIRGQSPLNGTVSPSWHQSGGRDNTVHKLAVLPRANLLAVGVRGEDGGLTLAGISQKLYVGIVLVNFTRRSSGSRVE